MTFQLTQANLASQNNKNTQGGTNPEKQTMQRFRQEHDQYRCFLVTGDAKNRSEQNAKHPGIGLFIDLECPKTANMYFRSETQVVTLPEKRQADSVDIAVHHLLVRYRCFDAILCLVFLGRI